MQVDETRMRRAAARIGAIGADARAYLQRERPALDAGSRGNDGFAAMAALDTAVDGLFRRAGDLAEDSAATGADVARAADNHAANERRAREAFDAGLRELHAVRAA